jgi:hypothetical protein
LDDVQLQDAITVIVDDDELGANPVMCRRPQGLVRVHASAIAGQTYDSAVRMRQLDANCTGQANAESSTRCLKILTGLAWAEPVREFGRMRDRLIED